MEAKKKTVDPKNLPPCPFCGGKVLYDKANRDTRTPDMVQCIGECLFEIQCEYKPGEALTWYLKAFDKGYEH